MYSNEQAEERGKTDCCKLLLTWSESKCREMDGQMETRGKQDFYPNKAWRGSFPLCDKHTHTHTGHSQVTSWCETAGAMMPLSDHRNKLWRCGACVHHTLLTCGHLIHPLNMDFDLSHWCLVMVLNSELHKTLHIKFQLEALECRLLMLNTFHYKNVFLWNQYEVFF